MVLSRFRVPGSLGFIILTVVLVNCRGGEQKMTTNHEGRNRLASETSPYLLQHADNPVHWYAWGEEAFEAARRLDKPIFLSVGYSTCHWCHVMAHESFEDSAVAALMNETFINIKVDREERPDVDQVYMAALIAMTGRGGWPMTIIMTPDKKPFYAATYIPKQSMQRRIGMLDLVPQLAEAWTSRRQEIENSTEGVLQRLEQRSQGRQGDILGEAEVTAAVQMLIQAYDEKHGGFGQAPKFPSPHNLILLLRESHRTGNNDLAEPVLHTLREMRKGGLYDQLGDGFHRYSTDAEWHLPHFEKMLYDQAMLMRAYTEAFQLSGDVFFKQTVLDIYTYIERDLLTPDGVFASAENADSEGEEGKFYIWSWEELEEELEEDDLHWLAAQFQLHAEGNFVDEATREPTGMNIFNLREDPENLEDWLVRWSPLRERLLEVRDKRVRPSLDYKVLTDWNALMISSLAYAGRTLDLPDLTNSAIKAADFILAHMHDEKHGLHHMLSENKLIPGFLDDYAFMVWALDELYSTSLEPKYLEWAIRLQAEQLEHFWDEQQGAFWFTPHAGEEMIVRQKEIYDGAIPSGNSIAASNLFRLARMTGKLEWEQLAEKLSNNFAGAVRNYPVGHTALLWTLQAQASEFREYVIAADEADATPMAKTIQRAYDPFSVLLFKNPAGSGKLAELAPFTAELLPQKGHETAYICEDHLCQAPSTELDLLIRSLERY